MESINKLCMCGCGEHVKSQSVRYIQYHHHRDSKIKALKKQTCIENYGVDSPFKSDKIKAKIKKTTHDRFGVDNISQSDIIKDKKKKTITENHGGFGFQSTNIATKINKTIIEKFGVDNVSKSEKVKKKKEQKSVDMYGVPCVFQSDEIKKEIKLAHIKNLGVDNPMKSKDVQSKSKITCLEKYNVEYSLQSPEVREKCKSTCLERFGVEYPGQSEEVKGKIQHTCQKRYGKDNWSQTDDGRKLHRINAIQRIEDQFCHGEPVTPTVGFKERPFLDELQKHTGYKILRQDPRYDIGRFPDGHIPELKLFILYDEPEHFINRECTMYNDSSLCETRDYESVEGYKLLRVSEIDWIDNRDNIINQFMGILNENN